MEIAVIGAPDDPLQPGRQIPTIIHGRPIWNCTSPMNSRGHSEKFIEAGTPLGYQGNYSGDPNNPVGMHLHFSIVEDVGNGKFKTELEISNTLDPRAI
jgi:hypothetical protein